MSENWSFTIAVVAGMLLAGYCFTQIVSCTKELNTASANQRMMELLVLKNQKP